MKVKILMAVAAISIVGVLAAGAAAGSRTPTKVTIKGSGGDYYGFVKSDDKQNCANGRKVTAYKVVGESPNPKVDDNIGTDTAQANGDGYMWAIGNSGAKHGSFYARVRKTDICGGDRSRVIDR